MSHNKGKLRYGRCAVVVMLVAVSTLLATAKDHVLPIAVMKITRGHPPVANVVIALEGKDDSQQFTGPVGEARLKLWPRTQPGDLVTVKLIKSPRGQSLEIISPLDGVVRVPPFEERAENHQAVYVAPQGSADILEYGPGILALHDRINRLVARRRKQNGWLPETEPTVRAAGYRSNHSYTTAVALRRTTTTATGGAEQEYAAALKETSAEFGLQPDDVTKALDSWKADDLAWKVIALTSSMEGRDLFSNISDIQGQDIEFGLAFWSIKACTLQPLLAAFRTRDEKLFDSILTQDTHWFLDAINEPCHPPSGESLIHKMLDDSGQIQASWRGTLLALSSEPVFQHVQVEFLLPRFEAAKQSAIEANLQSERAVALLYYLNFKSGLNSMRKGMKDYQADADSFSKAVHRPPDEQESLLLISNRSSQRWPAPFVRFIRAQQLIIASGEGDFGGRHFDLAAIGIELRSFATGQPIVVHNDASILRKLREGWLPR